MAGWRLITAPVREPITLEDARAHLRIAADDLSQDAAIALKIRAARQALEAYTGRAFLTQTWARAWDAWPDDRVLECPPAPLQSVSSVTIYDTAGAGTVVDPSAYTVDLFAAPPRVVMAADYTMPADVRPVSGLVAQYVAGFGDHAGAVPAALLEAVLKLTAALFAWRGDEGDLRRADPWGWPAEVVVLADPYRIRGV